MGALRARERSKLTAMDPSATLRVTMPPPLTRPYLSAVFTAGGVGAAWGLVDGLATWDQTALFLRGGEVVVLVGTGVAIGLALGVLVGGLSGFVARLREPLTSGALALAAITAVVAVARLVREPVLGRDVQLLPGGVPVALAVSLVAALLPLALVLLLGRGRLAPAVLAWKLWAAALVLITWFTPGAPAVVVPDHEPAPDAPNLLLVSLDTFRADHVGALGATGDPTPNLDRLAGEGVLFTRAFAQIPITGPSHMSILSGTYPWTHETLANGVAVPPSVPVLPEIARASGYRTAAFVSAFVLDGVFGYGRGFEVYDDALLRPKGVHDLSAMRLWEQARVRLGSISDVERRGGETVDDALAWLATVGADERFVLWVHLFDAHGPYQPPPPFDRAFYEGDPRGSEHSSMDGVTDLAAYMEPSLAGITDLDWPLAQYKGEIAYTDHQLGRLIGALRDQGLADDTIVLVVGDHGESLDEHGYYFNHGAHLYGASTRVPMVLVAPGQLPPGVRLDAMVENVDLLPTLLPLLELPTPPGLAGMDLRPLALGQAEGDEEALTICFDREANRAMDAFMRYRRVGIRKGSMSFIYREEGPEELYDLATDPAEEHDLAPRADHGYLVQLLTEQAEAILVSAGSGAFERAEGDLGAGIEERLRALGYVEDE